MIIKIRKASDVRSSEITPEQFFQQRRLIIKAAMASIAAWQLPAHALVEPQGDLPAIPNLKDSGIGGGLSPTEYKHVTSYNNFYEFGTGKDDPKKNSGAFKSRPWTISVEGECDAPGEIGIEDIFKLIDQEERVYRFRCVEAWAMVVPWAGFSLSTLLKRFKPNSKAKYVVFETLVDKEMMPGTRRKILDWPYQEGLRIDEAMHPLSMLVTGVYGKQLPAQNGAPLRLMVPWKYGFKSIKSIVKIKFVEKQPATTWETMAADEYGFYANVNPMVDHPRWTQAFHRNIGDGLFASRDETLMFNGYSDEVADLYRGMDLTKFY
jgi:sulfoxide reductase catalytic subunit YedY